MYACRLYDPDPVVFDFSILRGDSITCGAGRISQDDAMRVRANPDPRKTSICGSRNVEYYAPAQFAVVNLFV